MSSGQSTFGERFAGWLFTMVIALGALSILIKVKQGWGVETWLVKSLLPGVLFSAAWAFFVSLCGINPPGSSDSSGSRPRSAPKKPQKAQPKPPDQMLWEATKREFSEKVAEAEAIYGEIIETFPNSSSAHKAEKALSELRKREFIKALRKEEKEAFKPIKQALDAETNPEARKKLKEEIKKVKAEYKKKRKDADAGLYSSS